MTDDPPRAGPGVLERVAAIAEHVAGAGRVPPDAGPDTPLGERGYWLDSVEMLEVVVACEQAFGVVLDPATDLTAGALRTVRSLGDTIQARLHSRA